MKKEDKEPSDVISGTLNILGLKIDLEEMLSSPEELKDRLEGLREMLKQAGGKETLSDEEWRQGSASITGHIRSSSLLGDREFHIGAMGRPSGARGAALTGKPPRVVEPPIDVFDVGEQVLIVADVPAVGADEIELDVRDGDFTLSTKLGARRTLRNRIGFEAEVDLECLKSTCRNGVLEVRLTKSAGRET